MATLPSTVRSNETKYKLSFRITKNMYQYVQRTAWSLNISFPKNQKDPKDPRNRYVHDRAKEKKNRFRDISIILKNREKDHRSGGKGREGEVEGACHFSSPLSRLTLYIRVGVYRAAKFFFAVRISRKGRRKRGGRKGEARNGHGDGGARFTSVAGSSLAWPPFSEAAAEISTDNTQRGGSKHRPLLSSSPPLPLSPRHRSINPTICPARPRRFDLARSLPPPVFA